MHAQAARLGLAASGGARGVVGYLSDGDLGVPRTSTPPVPFEAVGGDVGDEGRCAWLWEAVEAASERAAAA